MKTKINTHWAAIATIILACTGLLQGQEKQQPRSERNNDNPRAQDNRRPALREHERDLTCAELVEEGPAK